MSLSGHEIMEKERFEKRWKDAVIERINKAGLTQNQVAEIIGTTQTNVNIILNNESRFFTLSQLAKLSDYFHVSIDGLIGRNQSGYAMDTLADIFSFFIELDTVMPMSVEYFDSTIRKNEYCKITLHNSGCLGSALKQYSDIKHNRELPDDIRALVLETIKNKSFEEFKDRKRECQYKDGI